MVALGPLGPVSADGSDEGWLISHDQVARDLPESIRGDFLPSQRVDVAPVITCGDPDGDHDEISRWGVATVRRICLDHPPRASISSFGSSKPVTELSWHIETGWQ